jgi:hypothetical protein
LVSNNSAVAAGGLAGAPAAQSSYHLPFVGAGRRSWDAWHAGDYGSAALQAGMFGIAALGVLRWAGKVKVGGVRDVSTVTEFSSHAIKRMAERGVTSKMAQIAINKGLQFYDPKNGTINFILTKQMGSGKDLLVAVDPLSRKVITVIVGPKLQRQRLLPIR